MFGSEGSGSTHYALCLEPRVRSRFESLRCEHPAIDATCPGYLPLAWECCERLQHPPWPTGRRQRMDGCSVRFPSRALVSPHSWFCEMFVCPPVSGASCGQFATLLWGEYVASIFLSEAISEHDTCRARDFTTQEVSAENLLTIKRVAKKLELYKSSIPQAPPLLKHCWWELKAPAQWSKMSGHLWHTCMKWKHRVAFQHFVWAWWPWEVHSIRRQWALPKSPCVLYCSEPPGVSQGISLLVSSNVASLRKFW